MAIMRMLGGRTRAVEVLGPREGTPMCHGRGAEVGGEYWGCAGRVDDVRYDKITVKAVK